MSKIDEKIVDKEWRMSHLYQITDKNSKKVTFVRNRAQDHFNKNKAQRNIILKSRQLGFCLDPETKILTADLLWIPIKNLQVGQEIVSVDELSTRGRGSGRRMKVGIVQDVVSVFRDAYRIKFDDGRYVICTGQHPWLSKSDTQKQPFWRAISETQKNRPILAKSTLKVGNYIRWITKPWGEPNFEDGWFSGVLDGEGSISKKNSSAGINVSQLKGFVWERLLGYVQKNGYHYRIEDDKTQRKTKYGKSPVPKICIGRMDEMFNLVGKLRPSRFVNNRFWENRELPGKKTMIGWSKIISIEQIANQEMIDLQTSTSTYIAEGFVSHNTTLESIDMLDDTLFTPHFESLFIAHTKEDASDIFDKKVDFAWKSLHELHLLWRVEADTSMKLKFDFGELDATFKGQTVSSISVANSGRSGTYNRVHISEFAKLCATYPIKAQEIITGTIPAVPIDGRIDIESTAQGMGGHFSDMFWEAWNRKEFKHPTQFKAHFYNWTWDDEEINKVTENIPVSQMEDVRFKELQEAHNLSDKEITYYYLKWLSLKKDWDILRQEYPTTPEEAFILSGSPYFNTERITQLIHKAKDPIWQGSIELKCNHPTKCEYIELCNVKRPHLTEESNGKLLIWDNPQQYDSYVLGGDTSEGISQDNSVVVIKNNKTLKTVASFVDGSCPPDEYALVVFALGMYYNYAYTGIESNKDGLWVNDTLFKMGYPNLFFRERYDDITKSVGKQLGFRTGARERDPILANLKSYLNNYDDIWVDRAFLQECLTFVRNKVGKPEAMEGKKDDRVMAEAIAFEIRKNAPSELNKPTPPYATTNEERIMARLEHLKKQKNKSMISQDSYF